MPAITEERRPQATTTTESARPAFTPEDGAEGGDVTQARYRRAKERVEAIRGFYIHAIVYLCVNAGLFAINMLTNPDTLWFYWPLVGWGIGLAINGLVVFAGGVFGPDWEERKIREALEDERRKQAGKPA